MQFNVQFIDKSPQSKPQPAAPKAEDTSLRYLLGRQWDQVNWNLGGVFLYDMCLQLHLSMYPELMAIPVPPVTVSGALPCLWSLDWFEVSKITPPDIIKRTLKIYAERNTPVYLYFDNPSLTEADLDDALGLAMVAFLLETNPTGKNGVYVASDLLARRLRKLYPRLPVKASVNRVTTETQRDAALYNSLAGLYDRVALHPLDAFNDDLLEGLEDRTRFEITVNDICLDTCPCRPEHMAILSQIRRDPWNIDLLKQRHQCLSQANCELIKRPEGSRPLSLTLDEFDRLFAMGFRDFRIQGESMRNELTFIHYLTRWMYNPDEEVDNKRAMLYSTLMISRKSPQAEYPTGIGDYRERRYD